MTDSLFQTGMVEDKTGISGAFLTNIVQQEGTNGIKLNLNTEIIQAVFNTYPAGNFISFLCIIKPRVVAMEHSCRYKGLCDRNSCARRDSKVHSLSVQCTFTCSSAALSVTEQRQGSRCCYQRPVHHNVMVEC